MPLDPTIAALLGAGIGAAIGGAISGATAWSLERRRWERHQSIRWDEARLAIYAQFLVAMQAYYPAQMKIKAEPYSPADSQASKDSTESVAIISTKLSEMGLVSEKTVHKAAVEWVESVNRVISGEGIDLMDRVKERNQAHDNFIEVASKELGAKRR